MSDASSSCTVTSNPLGDVVFNSSSMRGAELAFPYVSKGTCNPEMTSATHCGLTAARTGFALQMNANPSFKTDWGSLAPVTSCTRK